MSINTDIKFYMHTNTGIPQISNTYGCMLSVLDACLVNGFGSQNITSLTYNSGTATATFASAHNFIQYQVIKIIGANQTEYNIDTRILSIPNSTTITFKLNAVPTVTTATGVISCSLPSLGWEKPFSSSSANGGKGAYRSKNLLLSSRPFLRVVDELDPAYSSSYTKYAKVGIVEDMSDIDTMIGVQSPFDINSPNKNWVGDKGATDYVTYNGWARWYYASPAFTTNDNGSPTAGDRSFLIVGNSDYFYIIPVSYYISESQNTPFLFGFGSFTSLINNDTSNTFLCSYFNYSNIASGGYRSRDISGSSAVSVKLLLLKNYTQSNLYAAAKNTSLAIGNATMLSGAQDYIGPYSLTNIVPFMPVYILETILRGQMPNLYWLYHNKPYLNYQIIESNNSLYMAVNCYANDNQGQVLLKIGEI